MPWLSGFWRSSDITKVSVMCWISSPAGACLDQLAERKGQLFGRRFARHALAPIRYRDRRVRPLPRCCKAFRGALEAG